MNEARSLTALEAIRQLAAASGDKSDNDLTGLRL